MTKLKIKRIICFFVIISVCFILQSTLFYRLSFGFATPDIMVVLACVIGFIRREREGLFAGAYCGFLMDLFSDSLFGYYMLIFILIGFLCGLFSESYYADDIKLPVGLVMISDFVYHMYIYIPNFLLKGDTNLGLYIKAIIIPSIVYTVLVAIFLYLGLHYVNKKLESSERTGRNMRQI